MQPTGPNTEEGMAVASRNSIKHGIMSPHPVLIETMETEEDWERFRQGIVDSLQPEGALETELAESIALNRWRARRVTRYETASINHQVAKTKHDLMTGQLLVTPKGKEVPEPSAKRIAAYKEIRVVPLGSSLDQVIRYETHLHRQYIQLSNHLEALQARRRGESAPLARLDVSGAS